MDPPPKNFHPHLWLLLCNVHNVHNQFTHSVYVDCLVKICESCHNQVCATLLALTSCWKHTMLGCAPVTATGLAIASSEPTATCVANKPKRCRLTSGWQINRTWLIELSSCADNWVPTLTPVGWKSLTTLTTFTRESCFFWVVVFLCVTTVLSLSEHWLTWSRCATCPECAVTPTLPLRRRWPMWLTLSVNSVKRYHRSRRPDYKSRVDF